MRQFLLLFFLVFSFSVLYSQSASDTVALEEYELVSVSNPVAFRNISRTVHLISQEQIKEAPLSSIDDLLKVYGGVDIRSRGAMGVQSDISLRGGTFDQGLIMIDGIPLNDPQTGHHNLSQAISLDDIERVEVFAGPATRWFGANTFSGGINFIRKLPDPNSFSVSVSGGQYGYFSARAAADYKLGKILNRSSAGFSQSDGYQSNTDFKILNLNHFAVLQSENYTLKLNLGLLDKGFGANSFYTPKYPNQYEHIRNYSSSLSFETGGRFKLKTNIFWRRNYDRFELFREDKSWYVKQGDVYVNGSDTAGFQTPSGLYPYKGHNYHRTDTFGADATLNFNSALGKTAIAISAKSESIVSNVLGETMGDTIFISGSDGFYTKSKTRNTANLSLNQFYTFRNFSVSAGISAFYSNDYGFHLSPGIDIGYFINENLKVFAGLNKSIRLPTFTDLYYQGPTNIANPELQPETSLSGEAGLKFFKGSVNASLSGFYRKGENIIDWVKYSPHEKWQSANLSELNTYGISFAANKSFSGKFVNYAGLKYTWAESEKNNTELISLYSLDFLRHNLNLFVNHKIFKNLNASWTFTLQKRNGFYTDFASGLETEYETVALLNLKLSYSIKQFEINLTASNLLNRQYYDIGNVLQPGIWLVAGVKWQMKTSN